MVAWAVACAVAAVSLACCFSFQSSVYTFLLVGLSEQLQRLGSYSLQERKKVHGNAWPKRDLLEIQATSLRTAYAELTPEVLSDEDSQPKL